MFSKKPPKNPLLEPLLNPEIKPEQKYDSNSVTYSQSTPPEKQANTVKEARGALTNAKLALSNETILAKNIQFLPEITRGLDFLSEAKRATQQNFELLLKKPQHADKIAKGFIWLDRTGLNNKKNRELLIEKSEHADKIGSGLQWLRDREGGVTEKEGFYLLQYPENALEIAMSFSAFKKNVPYLYGETYMTLIAKHGKHVGPLAHGFDSLGGIDYYMERKLERRENDDEEKLSWKKDCMLAYFNDLITSGEHAKKVGDALLIAEKYSLSGRIRDIFLKYPKDADVWAMIYAHLKEMDIILYSKTQEKLEMALCNVPERSLHNFCLELGTLRKNKFKFNFIDDETNEEAVMILINNAEFLSKITELLVDTPPKSKEDFDLIIEKAQGKTHWHTLSVGMHPRSTSNSLRILTHGDRPNISKLIYSFLYYKEEEKPVSNPTTAGSKKPGS